MKIISARNRLRRRPLHPTFDPSKNNKFMIVSTETNLNYQRIEQAIKYLEDNFQRQPELDEVADKVHLSPFHFQRIFTDWAGISPKRFLQFLTIDFLKTKLKESKK